jgi:hypothetical protein
VPFFPTAAGTRQECRVPGPFFVGVCHADPVPIGGFLLKPSGTPRKAAGTPRKRASAARLARVEGGLERELITRHDIGQAERAALRAQARAVDTAEALGDPDQVSKANAVYLDLRHEAGLSAAGAKPTDDFEKLLAAAMRPTPGDSDTAHN